MVWYQRPQHLRRNVGQLLCSDGSGWVEGRYTKVIQRGVKSLSPPPPTHTHPYNGGGMGLGVGMLMPYMHTSTIEREEEEGEK